MNAIDRHLAVTSATLGEIARAISEHFERSTRGAFVVSTEQELKALKDLFQERAALIGEHISADFCGLAACLTLEAMLAQQGWDLKLFCQSQLPFCIR